METWQEYVRRIIDGDVQTEASARTGVSQKTISNWLNGVGSGEGQKKPEAGNVAAFATGYQQNVLVAFVAARLLTVDQTEGMVTTRRGLVIPAPGAHSVTTVIKGTQ